MSVALYESFGIQLTIPHFIGNIFVFIITMLFNLALFLMISQVANETVAFIGIISLSFVNLLVPGIHLFEINPGILIFLENMRQGVDWFLIKIALMLSVSIGFLIFVRRRIHANH